MARPSIAVLTLIATLGCRTKDVEPLKVGDAAPAYTAMSIAGAPVSLAGLRGKAVLLNAWATWCKPCLEEIPEFRALHAKYESRGLAVVGVSLDEDTATAPIRDFVRQHDMAYRIWHDPGQTMMTTFNFGGLPTTILVDTGGVVRWLSTGKVTPGDTSLDGAIRRALR